MDAKKTLHDQSIKSRLEYLHCADFLSTTLLRHLQTFIIDRLPITTDNLDVKKGNLINFMNCFQLLRTEIGSLCIPYTKLEYIHNIIMLGYRPIGGLHGHQIGTYSRPKNVINVDYAVKSTLRISIARIYSSPM